MNCELNQLLIHKTTFLLVSVSEKRIGKTKLRIWITNHTKNARHTNDRIKNIVNNAFKLKFRERVCNCTESAVLCVCFIAIIFIFTCIVCVWNCVVGWIGENCFSINCDILFVGRFYIFPHQFDCDSNHNVKNVRPICTWCVKDFWRKVYI